MLFLFLLKRFSEVCLFICQLLFHVCHPFPVLLLLLLHLLLMSLDTRIVSVGLCFVEFPELYLLLLKLLLLALQFLDVLLLLTSKIFSELNVQILQLLVLLILFFLVLVLLVLLFLDPLFLSVGLFVFHVCYRFL